jgi:hypothetical protein
MFATYGIPAAAAAATYFAGKSMLDGLKGKEDNSTSGKYGRGQAAYSTGGLSELGRIGSNLFGGDSNAWETEGNRLRDLEDKGTFISKGLLAGMPTGGRSNSDLINPNYASDYIGYGKDNRWINNKFADSRDESDLKPEDVVNYAAFAEKYPNWFNTPLDKRLEVAKYALDKGLIDENRGTIDIGESNDFETYVRNLLGL